MSNPDTVYVVGAGFSAGLGYPLTKSLLIDVWDQLERPSRNQLQKIIKFHHPAFDWKRKTSFPDIEQLLTEIHVNLALFDSSRPAEGNFTKIQLEKAREELLSTIAEWFHALYGQAGNFSWLEPFVKRLKDENAAVLSFNWDLILDHLLFPEGISSEGYGLSNDNSSGPLLLKPHGSLNWYEGNQINTVKDEKRITIFGNEDDSIGAFRFPRAIKSKAGKRYTPLIIPPTYLKDFARPLFRRLWEKSTEILSTAKKLVFLGYSLPSADLHAQFIFRCGFHNQIEGRLKSDGTRHDRTGAAKVKVTIVNPDQEAARHIEAVAGPEIPCSWVPKRIEEWVLEN